MFIMNPAIKHTKTFSVSHIDFFLRSPSSCTRLSLLTPPHTIPAVLVQTARKTTQNRKENTEKKTFFFILTHKTGYMWA